MVTREGISINQFDDKKWVINTPEGRNILVNADALRLYKILHAAESEEEAHASFNKEFGSSLSITAFKNLVTQKFSDILNLGVGDANLAESHSYLNLKVKLINRKVVGILARPLSVFYHQKFFWLAFIGLIAGFLVIHNLASVTQAATSSWLFLILFLFSVVIHEFGHIAACIKYKVAHGEVGFGVYTILPVMYANISNVWTLNKSQRIIINMGGVFSELLYAMLLYTFYLFSSDLTFYFLSLAVGIKALVQLNPFIRSDGYWLLSDLTNTPNLLPKSQQAINDAIRHILNGRKWVKLKKSQIMLIIYGVSNVSVIVLYLSFILVTYRESIFVFPQYVLELLINAGTVMPDIASVKKEHILIGVFYIILLKIIVKGGIGLYRKLLG